MANGIKKQVSNISTRQIPHIRLYDDGNIETRYELLDKLGEGSFGTVYRVKNKENDLYFAMKTIIKKVSFSFKKLEFIYFYEILYCFVFSWVINQKHQVLTMKSNC